MNHRCCNWLKYLTCTRWSCVGIASARLSPSSSRTTVPFPTDVPVALPRLSPLSRLPPSLPSPAPAPRSSLSLPLPGRAAAAPAAGAGEAGAVRGARGARRGPGGGGGGGAGPRAAQWGRAVFSRCASPRGFLMRARPQRAPGAVAEQERVPPAGAKHGVPAVPQHHAGQQPAGEPGRAHTGAGAAAGPGPGWRAYRPQPAPGTGEGFSLALQTKESVCLSVCVSVRVFKAAFSPVARPSKRAASWTQNAAVRLLLWRSFPMIISQSGSLYSTNLLAPCFLSQS